MRFNDYNHFKNYCFAIARNKGIKLKNKNYEYFADFEEFYNIISQVEAENKIITEGCMLNSICNYCKDGDYNEVMYIMQYLLKKLNQFNNKEINFYNICTNIANKLRIPIYFVDSFVQKENIDNKFFPDKIRVLELVEETTNIYPLLNKGNNSFGKFGVYFIFDENDKIAYIGKSTTNVKKRAFTSVLERKLSYFNKIKIKTTSKSNVGIYESYYIAKYKPIENKDGIYDDLPTICLPDLPTTEIITKDKNNATPLKYKYIKEKTYNTLDVLKRLGNDVMIRNPDNIQKFSIYEDKFIAKNKAIGDFYKTNYTKDYIIEDVSGVAALSEFKIS